MATTATSSIIPTTMPTVEPTITPTATPTASPIVTEKPAETAKATEEPTACFVVDNQGTLANITNNGEEQTVAVIIAEYDEKTLKSVNSADITFVKDEKRTFMLGNRNYKVFVWNSLKDMVPMTK